LPADRTTVETSTFPWPETAEALAALWRAGDLQISADRGGFATRDGSVRVVVPAVLPIADSVADATSYLESLPRAPGSQLVLLLRAGVAALGWWHDDDLLRHKVFKRYVVRGSGRAQPTHLARKGKSRYGSRLRLRNAQALLAEVNERLTEWIAELGTPTVAFYACAVRQWAELQRTRPGPPLPPQAFRRIRLAVREPSFEELCRVRRALSRGRIERRAAPA
jgi:hypothetical protein